MYLIIEKDGRGRIEQCYDDCQAYCTTLPILEAHQYVQRNEQTPYVLQRWDELEGWQVSRIIPLLDSTRIERVRR